MSDKTQADTSKLHIQIDDDVANGVYSNLAMVNHTETEFTFDFIYVQPQQPRAKVRARIITNAKHTKRILIALTENIARYEQRFGVIDVTPSPGEPEYH
ncbi:MAG: DUF3467 domain-containing protein [Deltaproteobacteria bacterium]|nr:DUF3467 domain-containing protein [Deltaproteobacteria bacterium]